MGSTLYVLYSDVVHQEQIIFLVGKQLRTSQNDTNATRQGFRGMSFLAWNNNIEAGTASIIRICFIFWEYLLHFLAYSSPTHFAFLWCWPGRINQTGAPWTIPLCVKQEGRALIRVSNFRLKIVRGSNIGWFLYAALQYTSGSFLYTECCMNFITRRRVTFMNGGLLRCFYA